MSRINHSKTHNPIAMVEGYPYLFDTSHKEYKNIKKKQQTWEEISLFSMNQVGLLNLLGYKQMVIFLLEAQTYQSSQFSA